MAHESLKAAVAADIYENTDNEIGGDELQTVFNSLVIDYLGDPTYIGLAVPATAPSAYEKEVFFMASEIGVYSNFSGNEITANGVYTFRNIGGGSTWTMEQVLGLQEIIDAVNAGKKPYYPFANGEDVDTPTGINNFFVDLEFTFDLLENKRQLYVDRIWNGSSGNYGFRVYDELTSAQVCSFYQNPFTPDPSGYDTLVLTESNSSGITGKAIVNWSAMAFGTYNSIGTKFDQRTHKYQDIINANIKPYPYSQFDENGEVTSTFRSVKDVLLQFESEADYYTEAGIREFKVTRLRRNKSGYSQIYINEVSTGTLVAIFSTDQTKSGFEVVELAEQNSSGITGRVWIDWDEITTNTDSTSSEQHVLQENFIIKESALVPISHNFLPNYTEYPIFNGYGQMPQGFVPYSIRATNPTLTLKKILDCITRLKISGIPDDTVIALDVISRNDTTNGNGYMLKFIYQRRISPSPIWSELATFENISITESAAATERYSHGILKASQANQPTFFKDLTIEYGIDYKSLPDDFYCEINQNSDDTGHLVYQIVNPANIKKVTYQRLDSTKFYTF